MYMNAALPESSIWHHGICVHTCTYAHPMSEKHCSWLGRDSLAPRALRSSELSVVKALHEGHKSPPQPSAQHNVIAFLNTAQPASKRARTIFKHVHVYTCRTA